MKGVQYTFSIPNYVATRAAVIDAMKAIAATGRHAVAGEPGVNPFRMPQNRSASAVLAVARYFMAEAERRREKFVELGMPPTFLADFTRLVDDLEQAIGVQQDSRAARRKASTGIASSSQKVSAATSTGRRR